MLMTAKQYFRCFEASEVWRRYRDAMVSKRPGSALTQNRFGWYVRHRCVVYTSQKGSAIFGQVDQDGVLMVSHHAPISKRDGVELLKKLAKDDLKVVFAVTNDMVTMLERLGFKNCNHVINTDFRGICVKKHILTNF